MTWSMFNELKSDIVVGDKSLETTYTANYSKSAHRIKNEHMQKSFDYYYYIYNSHDSLLSAVSCMQSKKSDSTVTITANRMDANNKVIIYQDNRKWRYTLIAVSYIDQTQGSYLISP